MDIVKVVRVKLEEKIKALEDLKKRLPRKCGEIVQNIPLELGIKIGELEEEIKRLKEELEMAKCKVCETCYESVCEGYEKVEGGD